MYVSKLLLLLLLWNPAQHALAQVDRATEEAAIMGRLLAEAIDCGEPLEELRPYIGYIGLYLGYSHEVKTKQGFDEISAALGKSLGETLKASPESDCDKVYKNLDDLKRACQVFYHSLAESEQRRLNLDPLPAPK